MCGWVGLYGRPPSPEGRISASGQMTNYDCDSVCIILHVPNDKIKAYIA